MRYVERIVRFLEGAVTVNLGRYLLIFFLCAFAFVFFWILNMGVRALLDPVLTKVARVPQNSRFLPVPSFLIALVLAYFLLGLIYAAFPVLSPLSHTNLRF